MGGLPVHNETNESECKFLTTSKRKKLNVHDNEFQDALMQVEDEMEKFDDKPKKREE